MKTKYKFIMLVLVACLCSIAIYYKIEHPLPVESKKSIIAFQSGVEKNLEDSSKYTFQNPKVILNPYRISPLSALIIFETKDLTTPSITIKGKDERTTITNTFKPGHVHYIPVYGLYPNTKNKVILSVNGIDKTIIIETKKLPNNITKAESVSSNKTLINNELFFTSGDATTAYDINGDIRWYLTGEHRWSIKRLRNGHLLISGDRLMTNNNYNADIYEIDLLGKVYYTYTIPGGYHYDALELPNNNLLLVSNDGEKDNVIELDRNTGEIIKTFEFNLNKGSIINSIWYHEQTNSIFISESSNNKIISIDYSTSKINWIMSNPDNLSKKDKLYLLKPIKDNFIWQEKIQSISAMSNGNILLFYNQSIRTFSIDNNNSTIEETWNYKLNTNSSSFNIVNYLSTNHYLINTENKIIEINDNKKVFELSTKHNIFEADKIHLYSHDIYNIKKGEELGDTNVTIPHSKFAFTLTNKDSNDIIKKYKIKIVKERDRLVVTGNFNEKDKVYIILDNIFSKKVYDLNITNPITTKYINDKKIAGKYYLYIKINNKLYDLNRYVMYY